jgi:dTDP-4-amino-4,6-dideoxygalactose transaminase
MPVHLQPYYANMGFKKGYCPNAEKYYSSAISIPMYPDLTDGQIQYVVDRIKEVL